MRMLSALALLLLFALPAAASREDELMEMSLEELLQVQLDQMAVTGIHHTHDAGEWMLGTSHMFMAMDGNQSGTSELGRADVFARGYTVAPPPWRRARTCSTSWRRPPTS